MSQTTSPGTGKPYGLERVCRVLEFPRSTIYAQQARENAKVVPLHPVRRGPEAKDCRC
jgi:putative transposase